MRTADVHTGCHTLEIFVVGAVDGIALNVGFRLGRGVTGDHVAVIFGSLGKTVAAGVALGVGVGTVHLDAFPDAQLVLVIGAAADVTSQIAHDFIFLSQPSKRDVSIPVWHRLRSIMHLWRKLAQMSKKTKKHPVILAFF